MKSRIFATVGMTVPGWFVIVYVIMSSLRPEYSLFTKAISELGSMDAPNKLWWNILGYCISGLMIAFFSIGLFDRSSSRREKLSAAGIFGSGVFMTLSGIFPIDMENRDSLTSLLHFVGSFGSYIFFLIGAFTFPSQGNEHDHVKSSRVTLLAFAWLTIFCGAWPFLFPEMPGVGQRLVFSFYFCWIFYAAWKLYQTPSSTKQSSRTVVS